jgi:hypothetical protein
MSCAQDLLLQSIRCLFLVCGMMDISKSAQHGETLEKLRRKDVWEKAEACVHRSPQSCHECLLYPLTRLLVEVSGHLGLNATVLNKLETGWEELKNLLKARIKIVIFPRA